ncbi:hypothetical protein B0H14DRAFT_2637146 [Mycena olivaceomarginata]|nr:hypothetical protein B0H14DRAFT_2637146 [Mycena olivaceomarginata]
MARQNGDITMPQHQQPNAHNNERGSGNPCFYNKSDSKSSRTFFLALASTTTATAMTGTCERTYYRVFPTTIRWSSENAAVEVLKSGGTTKLVALENSSNIAKGGEIWRRDWDFNPFADHMVDGISPPRQPAIFHRTPNINSNTEPAALPVFCVTRAGFSCGDGGGGNGQHFFTESETATTAQQPKAAREIITLPLKQDICTVHGSDSLLALRGTDLARAAASKDMPRIQVLCTQNTCDNHGMSWHQINVGEAGAQLIPYAIHVWIEILVPPPNLPTLRNVG